MGSRWDDDRHRRLSWLVVALLVWAPLWLLFEAVRGYLAK